MLTSIEYNLSFIKLVCITFFYEFVSELNENLKNRVALKADTVF